MENSNSLEGIATEQKPNLVKRVFSKEWPTMVNHLVSCGVAIGAATETSEIMHRLNQTDAATSLAATIADSGSYWVAFLPQLLYRDRNILRDDSGKLSPKKIGRKSLEYLGLAGFLEGGYFIARSTGQYWLQKKGWDPVNASLAIQGSAVAFFTVALPFMRYGLNSLSEKRQNKIKSHN